MFLGRNVLFATLSLTLALPLSAADWPQWRGPQRNGVAPDSPALADSLPTDLKPLWTSDPLPSGDANGYSSVAVAAGKAYIYVNQNTPVPWRLLSKGALANQGYVADMPADLAAAVETARTSDERKSIKDNKAVETWINEWIKANLKEDQSRLANPIRARLRAGANAIPLEVLAKAANVADKRFETQADAQAALAAAGLEDTQQKRILPMMVPEQKDANDSIHCLDAGTGKTLWKTPIGGQWFYFAASSTPTVADGRVYVWNSEARIYCLDAATGQLVFKSDPFGPDTFHHARASSVLVADSVAIAVTDACLAAVDAATGKTLWQDNKVKNQQSSAITWVNNQKTYALVLAINNKLLCIDSKTGATVWTANARGGGQATPAVAADLCLVATGSHLVGFHLAPDKPEELFQVPWKESHSSPLIHGDHAYVLGEAYGAPNKARAICIDLKTGQVAWEQPAGNAQLSSPILADGKVIAVAGPELLIFRASPDKFDQLARVNLGLEKWSSPALVDGKLFLRSTKAVVCYDLRK